MSAIISEDSREALKHGAAAFRRVVFPLLAMLLLVAGRAVLGGWHKTNLLSVAIPLFGSLAGIRFAVYLLRLAFSQAAWLDVFERSIATLIWAAFALHLTGLLREIVAWLSEVKLSVGKHSLSVWALLSAAFWIAVTLLLALWAGAALEARLMRAEGLHSSLRVVFGRLGRAVLLVAAMLLVLPLMGVDLTVLSVFGGALGVGLGLGMAKAFDELAALGWLAEDRRPRFYACQSDGCAPIPRAFAAGERFDFVWTHPPYWRQKLYAADARDLSRCPTLDVFLDRYATFIDNCARLLTPRGKLAIFLNAWYHELLAARKH